jgi:hypothetical protein
MLPGPLGDRLLRYLRLFSPRSRALSPDRAARLLTELLGPIAEAKVERHGRTWPAPLDYWSHALDEILSRREQLQLPLRSHGYLLEIVAAIAGKAEARTEAKVEQTRAYALGREQSQAGLVRAAPPEEFRQLVERLKRKETPHDPA